MSATRRLAKARRYLRSAKLLLRDGDLDSAVSRAYYYAVLHAAKALLMIYGHPEVESWKTHGSLLNLLAREDRRFTWFRGIQPFSGERDFSDRSPPCMRRGRTLITKSGRSVPWWHKEP